MAQRTAIHSSEKETKHPSTIKQRNTACHRIFQSEYILSMVFSFTVGPPQHQRNLLAIALVCKTFLNPAIAQLWRDLESIMPILRLIPSLVWSRKKKAYILSSPIELDAQNTVYNYSKRVRTLILDEKMYPKMDYTIIHYILAFEKPLFPNLQDLSITPSTSNFRNASTSVASLALSNSLSSLTIFSWTYSLGEGTNFSFFLGILHQRGAPLRKLDLTLGSTHYQYLTLIGRFTKLESICLELHGLSIDPHIVLSWTELPNLTTLALVIFFKVGNLANFFSHGKLSRGHDLAIVAYPKFISELFRPFSSLQNFLKINLIIPCLDTSMLPIQEIMDPVLKFIHRSKSIWSLNTFCITIRTTNGCTTVTPGCRQAGPYFPVMFIQKLSECKQLTSLMLPDLNAAIDDNIVRELCTSGCWGKLCTLHLPDTILRISLSLTILAVIARHCPGLQDLDICIDFNLHSCDSLKAERQRPVIVTHPLRHLGLTIYSCKPKFNKKHLLENETVSGVSRFINYCFPSLKEVEIKHFNEFESRINLLLFDYHQEPTGQLN